MRTAWNTKDRRALADRVRRLRPDSRAAWGRMNAPQMVSHLIEALRMALGELRCTPKSLPIRYPPLKQFVIYWMPFPKGAPTARELIARPPGEWNVDLAELQRLLEVCASRGPQAAWPDHPAFGRLSSRGWGVLIYRHTDHHLRQFGV